MSHEIQDRVSLEMARQIASGLAQHPEWLDIARGNLDRWSRQNQQAPSLLRCYAEWQKMLARPVSEICDALTDLTELGQRLRQNSPFAGILSPDEVWEIKSRFRHATSAT